MDMSTVRPVWQRVEKVMVGEKCVLTITTSSYLSEGEKRMKAESKQKRDAAKEKKKAAREVVEEHHTELTDDFFSCCDGSKARAEFVKMKACGHIFHADCVKSVRKNCPTCRVPFEKKLEYNEDHSMWFEY